MKTIHSNYGTLFIGDQESLLAFLLELLQNACNKMPKSPARIGLSGGSTPQAFYRWCVDNEKLPPALIERALWFVSDERCVPLDHPDSNFGVADRLLLKPLQASSAVKWPWPVDALPPETATLFNDRWREQFGMEAGFDLCLLGMGDDGHTASLFPLSPLIESGVEESFASVGVTGKGWRLTITPAGLQRCSQIVVSVQGSGKAAALKKALEGPFEPYKIPIQLLRHAAERVIWLLDEAAAAELSLGRQ